MNEIEEVLREFFKGDPTVRSPGSTYVIAAIGNEMCSDDAFSFYTLRRLTELRKRDMLFPGLSLMMCAGGLDFFTERIVGMRPERLLLLGTRDSGVETGEVDFIPGKEIDDIFMRGKTDGRGNGLSSGAGDVDSFLSTFEKKCPDARTGMLAVQPASIEVGPEMDYEVMVAADGVYEILVGLFFVQ